ncbi:unnamed protein product, partial [Coregonus sp. 'balchen']
MQMCLMMADIERDMKNDFEQNRNREAQDRKITAGVPPFPPLPPSGPHLPPDNSQQKAPPRRGKRGPT